MKIMHYFLGFPPYRTGGMTKFAIDLMKEQVISGETVVAVYPGRINFIFNKNKIKFRNKINFGISSYEIINPLPISLDEGINLIESFTRSADINIFINFLKKINPDIIHIHTLMGLHSEFIEAAQILKIKTVFTTHDYFGICPKVVLYKEGCICSDDHDCFDCIECNKYALSLSKIKIMQSPIYKKCKNLKLVKKLRKKHREKFLKEERKKGKIDSQLTNNEERKKSNINSQLTNNEYLKLRKFYINMLENIDVIHFNSNLSKEIYMKYMKPKKYEVINITHANIKNNKKNLDVESNKIRYTFLGSNKPYKGFYYIKNIFDELNKKSKYEFELNVYSDIKSDIKNKSSYINIFPNRYSYEDLKDIFANTDILIVPSLWYETFGFNVVEALSYGIPVILSKNVGAKDIVKDYGYIYNNDKELKEILLDLSKEKINKIKRKIINEFQIKEMNLFYHEIKNIYGDNIKNVKKNNETGW